MAARHVSDVSPEKKLAEADAWRVINFLHNSKCGIKAVPALSGFSTSQIENVLDLSNSRERQECIHKARTKIGKHGETRPSARERGSLENGTDAEAPPVGLAERPAEAEPGEESNHDTKLNSTSTLRKRKNEDAPKNPSALGNLPESKVPRVECSKRWAALYIIVASTIALPDSLEKELEKMLESGNAPTGPVWPVYVGITRGSTSRFSSHHAAQKFDMATKNIFVEVGGKQSKVHPYFLLMVVDEASWVCYLEQKFLDAYDFVFNEIGNGGTRKDWVAKVKQWELRIQSFKASGSEQASCPRKPAAQLPCSCNTVEKIRSVDSCFAAYMDHEV